MKRTIYLFLTSLVLLASCNDKLDEVNHSNLTPDFFGTVQGAKSGLNAAYAGFRQIYGPEEGLQAMTNAGADEMRTANSNRTSNMVDYTSNYNPSNEFCRNLWNTAYRQINTCNGVIDYSENLTGISESDKNEMLGEAKFLRAQYYFLLVQSFGDVTLNEHYISSPETYATRADMLDVYNLIISDLQDAKQHLPASPQTSGVEHGKATAAAARHLLAKVYLTLGWVHNKNGELQTTGNYHKKYYNPQLAQEYFKKAYDEATSLINDAPSIGVSLLPNFADIFKAGNENNQEVLWNVQYESGYTSYGGNHLLNHLYITLYTNIMQERNVKDGRPYAWYRANSHVYNHVFGDKENDSRYAGTFQEVWYATKTTGDCIFNTKLNGENYDLVGKLNEVGDTAIWMPGYNMSKAEIESKINHRGEGKNIYWLITPEMYTNKLFPTMTKYQDPNRIGYNDNSMRPIIVYRLGETYLIAAEAAMLLNDKVSAAKYLNILRERAGFEGHKEKMDVKPEQVNLDFILDERTRELLCEFTRWFDLVRTGTLLERVKKYDDYEAYKNIKWYDCIRPIPQDQIDRVITGTPYPQNEGWQ